MAHSVGIIKETFGSVIAKNAQGEERFLQVGDEVYADETISTLSHSSEVTLSLLSGRKLLIGGDDEVLLDESVIRIETYAHEAVVDNTALQQALLLSDISLDQLDDTQAGTEASESAMMQEAFYVESGSESNIYADAHDLDIVAQNSDLTFANPFIIEEVKTENGVSSLEGMVPLLPEEAEEEVVPAEEEVVPAVSDTAYYSGNFSEYAITPSVSMEGYCVITDTVEGRDGSDLVSSDIVNFQFADTLKTFDQLINDAPTLVTLENETIAENMEGEIVGALHVDDVDDETHTFSVDDERFEVVDGDLKLKEDVSLDFENEESVVVTVTATDNQGESVSQDFVIDIENRDDMANIALTTSLVSTVTATTYDVSGARNANKMSFDTLQEALDGQNGSNHEAGTLVYKNVNHSTWNLDEGSDHFMVITHNSNDATINLSSGNNTVIFEKNPGKNVNISFGDGDDVIGLPGVQGDYDLSALNENNGVYSGVISGPDNMHLVINNAECITFGDGMCLGDNTLIPGEKSSSVEISGSVTDVEAGQVVVITVIDSLGKSVETHAVVNAEGVYSTSVDVTGMGHGNFTTIVKVEDIAGNVAKASEILHVDDVSSVPISLVGTIESGTLVSATILVQGYQQGEDYLLFNNALLPVGVKYQYSIVDDAVMIRFQGEASTQEYGDLLKSLTYENTAAEPAGGIRNIQISVNDGNDENVIVETALHVEGNNPMHSILETPIEATLNNDFIVGSDEDDTIHALAGEDYIFSGGGDDTIAGGAGIDVIDAGSGDDVIVYDEDDYVDGNEGNDTVLLSTNTLMDFNDLQVEHLNNIETIDMKTANGEILNLSPQDVINITDTTNTLTLLGDSADSVTLEGNWTQSGQETVDDTTFDVYTGEDNAILRVEESVRVDM